MTSRLTCPTTCPSNEYLNVEGRKMSKSRKWFIAMGDALERYDPDPWRYALTAGAPETQDVNFTWEEFVRRNNEELVATWGNLANRVLGFAYKRFDGKVPEPGPLDRDRPCPARPAAAHLRARHRAVRSREAQAGTV